jgi:putative methionine-R-sulfoxide reductase with GAF domain
VRKDHPSAEDARRRDARVAGLRDFQTPSLEAIEHRRAQLWLRVAIGLVAVVVASTFLSTWGAGRVFVLEAGEVRSTILGIGLAAFVVAAIREVRLSRLTRELTDERVLTAALTTRLNEVELLLEAGREMNAQLELTTLLETILRSATDLLNAEGGSVMLLEGDELVTVQARGRDEARDARVFLGEGVAGRVAVRREPVLIEGHARPDGFPGLPDRPPYVDSAMCVPLLHDDHLEGVLNVNAPIGLAFTQHDLRALAVFGQQAAMAIVNARRYEAERSQVAELRQHVREVG